MADEVRVDPAILYGLGRAARGLRDAVRGELADVEPETGEAARSLRGWQLGGVLEQVMWDWRDDLAGCARYLDGLAGALDGCARDYEHSDTASAYGFASLSPTKSLRDSAGTPRLG